MNVTVSDLPCTESTRTRPQRPNPATPHRSILFSPFIGGFDAPVSLHHSEAVISYRSIGCDGNSFFPNGNIMSEETIAKTGEKSASKRKAAIKGASFMAVAGLLIAITHVLVRDLSSDVHPIQIAFFRNLVGFLMLVPFLLRQDRVHWKSKQPKLQFIRAIIGTCAMFELVSPCLSMLPVADATAISFVTVLFHYDWCVDILR